VKKRLAYYQSYLVPRINQPEAADAFMEIMQRAKPGDKPYAHPFYWAAFTYNGL
jgi:CHAT domain-containing protein